MINTILVAIDTTDEQARSIVRVAASLAKDHDARLYALAVFQFSPQVIAGPGVAVAASPPSPEEEARLRDETTDQLNGIISDAAVDVEPLVEQGNPVNVINGMARTLDADLTVVGCHQKGFWKALLDPSVSKTLLDDAPNALFVVTSSFIERLG